MGCLPIGVLGLLILVLVAAAALRSCGIGGEVVVPQQGPDLEFKACMEKRGWVGTILGRRLKFELGDRTEADLDRAMEQCDESVAAG